MLSLDKHVDHITGSSWLMTCHLVDIWSYSRPVPPESCLWSGPKLTAAACPYDQLQGCCSSPPAISPSPPHLVPAVLGPFSHPNRPNTLVFTYLPKISWALELGLRKHSKPLHCSVMWPDPRSGCYFLSGHTELWSYGKWRLLLGLCHVAQQ